MIAVLLTGLLLCGCGGDTSEDVQPPPRENTDEKDQQIYVEQSVKEGTDEDDPIEQTVWQYGEIQMYQTEKGMPYIVKNEKDGSVMQETCSWKKNWEKKFKKKFISIWSWQKINDKTYYVVADEYSMDPAKVRDDREENLKDFYVVHRYLLRLDYETGEIQEIPTPQQTSKEYYKELGRSMPADENEKEIFYYYHIQVLPNGNFLLLSFGKPVICDGVTGEKLVDLDLNRGEDVGLYTAVGDGFIAAMTEDAATHKCELHLFDSGTGTEQYNIPLDFQEKQIDEETSYVNFAMGASGDSIYFVYDKCIYKMDYGDEQLEKVLDADENKMFYLPDEEYEYESICMGEEDDYFVRMVKEYNDRICHYFKKGIKNHEE